MSTLQPQLQHLVVDGPAARTGAPRRLAWWNWACAAGATDHIVVCVHGLSRQGRDFDTLAMALSERSRVVAVDVAGRGHSDWLADPMAYQVPTYVADLSALMHHLREQTPGARIDWVGTSMGGLIGMGVAAQPSLSPRRLVLNDVGPVIQWEALLRIGAYLGLDPAFPSEQAAIDYMSGISIGFGPHTADQWRALSLPMLRRRGDQWHFHYDPAIAIPFKAMTLGQEQPAMLQAVRAGEAALWDLYDAIAAPTLLLRGEQSDLLSRETVAEMSQRGPRPRCVSFAGVGHAPTLVAPDQVAAVRDFLWSP